jgi:hypothetical protein
VLEAAEKSVRRALIRSQETGSDLDEAIARLTLSPSPLGRRSAGLFHRLRQLLPLTVDQVYTNAQRPIAMVASLRSGRGCVSSSDGGYVHPRIALIHRSAAPREELLKITTKFPGCFFKDSSLTFLISSERHSCRFVVVLHIPGSYRWCRVAISSVRIDFGADPDATLDSLAEIARTVHFGSLWLTRFTDAVVSHCSSLSFAPLMPLFLFFEPDRSVRGSRRESRLVTQPDPDFIIHDIRFVR